MNSWYHSEASARKWGGDAEDYIRIHEFIDSSKRIIGDIRHRSLYHHTEGIWLCQELFGRTIIAGGRTDREREVPVRLIAELHVEQDLGWIPSPKDYIDQMLVKQWMSGSVRREVRLETVFKPLTETCPNCVVALGTLREGRCQHCGWQIKEETNG